MSKTREILEGLKELGGQAWDAGKPMFDHGRTEAAAAVFAGHGYVLYMHTDKEVEQPQQGVENLEHKQEDHEREM